MLLRLCTHLMYGSTLRKTASRSTSERKQVLDAHLFKMPHVKVKESRLASIFGLTELLHLELEVAVLWEAVKVLGQNPRLSLDHDRLFGATVN